MEVKNGTKPSTPLLLEKVFFDCSVFHEEFGRNSLLYLDEQWYHFGAEFVSGDVVEGSLSHAVQVVHRRVHLKDMIPCRQGSPNFVERVGINRNLEF